MKSLHYNRSNSYLFVNGVKICQFKVKDSELFTFPLCLRNISKDFEIVENIKETGLNGYVYDFSLDYFSSVNNIIDIHRCLMKKNNHSVQTLLSPLPPVPCWRGGVNFLPNFQKGGA